MAQALADPIWVRGGKVLVRSDVQEICVSGKQLSLKPKFLTTIFTNY